MRTSEQTGALVARIALLQAEAQIVQKDGKVDATTDKGGFRSKFATYVALWKVAQPLLAKHEIAFIVGGDCVDKVERVVCRVAHGDQWIESSYPAKPSRDGAQAFGGAVSFARRWLLRDMLGLVSSDDPDEVSGYQDAQKARAVARVKSAPGLGTAEASIREATTVPEFEGHARRARADFSRGDESARIEAAINGWLVAACDVLSTPEQLAEIKDAMRRIQPRGTDVRSALATAEKRAAVKP